MMLTSILTLLVPIALWLIERFISVKAQDDESRSLLIKLAQILRAAGVKRAKSRFEAAEDQLDAGNAEWDRRDDEQRKNEGKPK
jgi:hypothetical protein